MPPQAGCVASDSPAGNTQADPEDGACGAAVGASARRGVSGYFEGERFDSRCGAGIQGHIDPDASFLYGLLRPLDAIRRYRLEGDAVLPGHDDQTMFGYWQGRLTEAFLEKIHADDGILVNLASSEMKRLFDWKRIRREARIITPEFRIREGDRLKTIVVYTKMCRGEMTRHLIRNRIADPEMLKEFEWEGFRFDAALSRGDDWTFTM